MTFSIQLMSELEEPIKNELSSRFNIIELLGKGSFGNVYQCLDLQDHLPYAVKVISKLNVKECKIETLKEEAKLLKSLSHQNIVKIYEYGEFQSCIYIKMDIAKKGNLRTSFINAETLIQRKKMKNEVFNDQEASRIMGQIFMGISYIHSLNIIHRDIKPENILLTQEKGSEVVKIADFGLSTKLNFHYPKSAIAKCGTLLFMAPQILCKYSYTKAIDVWSASVIMFFLFNGKHPIWNDTMTTDQYSTIVSRISQLPPLNNAKNLAQDFFNRISRIDPQQRYSAQEGLKHPWITRQFQDQIPLAVHESYSSFATGNQISKIMKCLITLRNVYCSKKPEIPFQYREKILIRSERASSKDMKSTFSKLTKLRSMNFDRESSSEQRLDVFDDKLNNSRKNMRIISETDQENPTINKLNQIFNTLFDKKITSKKKLQIKEKQQPSKDLFADTPIVYEFKDTVETEIERSVLEVLQKNRHKSKRILPVGPSKLNRMNTDYQPKSGLSVVTKASFIRKSKLKKRITAELK